MLDHAILATLIVVLLAVLLITLGRAPHERDWREGLAITSPSNSRERCCFTVGAARVLLGKGGKVDRLQLLEFGKAMLFEPALCQLQDSDSPHLCYLNRFHA